ncbi:MAG: hypothetical protein FWG98_08465, partial [Candidatus Cloacimonetes bacterium]|nr:hypothetical protein [Candidatus Cloacimonadota bacterium]
MKNALSFDFSGIVRNAQNTHSGDTLQKRSFLHYFSVLSSLLPLYALKNNMFTPPPPPPTPIPQNTHHKQYFLPLPHPSLPKP